MRLIGTRVSVRPPLILAGVVAPVLGVAGAATLGASFLGASTACVGAGLSS
jgi:hypothetical protein